MALSYGNRQLPESPLGSESAFKFEIAGGYLCEKSLVMHQRSKRVVLT